MSQSKHTTMYLEDKTLGLYDDMENYEDNKDILSQFRNLKVESCKRMDLQELTNKDFLEILLMTYELHLGDTNE